MENNNLQLSKAEITHYKRLISKRFLQNPRMSLLFNKNKKSFEKNVSNLVDYCFHLALKANGVYVTKNKQTIVLFYEQNQLKKSFGDYLRYLKVIKGIPISKLKNVMKSEKEVKENKLDLDNFIYVWFIAQDEAYEKIDGLIEINQKLLALSNKKQLPLMFETSDSRLLNFYTRAGFTMYNQLERGKETIYFFADKYTVENS